MVLVDTSVWIEVFRRGAGFSLEPSIDFDEIVTCLPIIQEVLQGFRDESAFRLAHEALYALPIVESPLGASLFDDAIDLYRLARQAGRTVRSSVDCLIAACALRHDLELVHQDRDFDAIASISRLRSRSIRPASH